MERESDYDNDNDNDNDGLDPSEEYFRKKKLMMRILISRQKNHNRRIIKNTNT